MAWACRIDGHVIRLDDLPIDLVDRVAKQTGVHWFELVGVSPAKDLVAAQQLLVAVAERAGLTPPAGLTVRQLLESFDQVEDDLPDVWEDGNPKAEAGTTTE